MNILIMPPEQIAAYVGDRFQEQMEKKPNSVLGMTTGSSPLKFGIYDELIQREKQNNLDFSEASFINPDELLGLPKDHPETYYTYMNKHLFHAISYKAAYIPNSETTEPEEECQRFDETIAALGGVDLQLMGLGLNGHIAFMEPETSIPASTYVVTLEERNRPNVEAFDDDTDVPTHAITVGLGYVMKAKSIIVVAVGEEKAAIVKEALMGPITTKVPASFLQLHPDVTIIVDEGSAQQLPPERCQVR